MALTRDAFTREYFLSLIGSVRANGSFQDEPLLAVYDGLIAQLRDEQLTYLTDVGQLQAQLAAQAQRSAALEGQLATLQSAKEILEGWRG